MRIVVLLLLVVLAGAAVWFLASPAADEPVPGAGSPNGPVDGSAADRRAPAEPPATALPAGTNATRAAAERRPPTDLAGEPTCHLQVIDHGSRAPIANASVRRVQTADEVATTDERGTARLPLREPQQLAVVRDGYLLRLVPARVGTTADDPQQVELVHDEWSPRVRLAFRVGDRTAPGEAFVRFRFAEATPPAAVPPTMRAEPVLQRAWFEHGTLAGRPVCSDVRIELGVHDENRVHRLVDRQEIRFVAPGAYDCEVATLDGFVARTRVVVPPRVGVDAPIVAIELQRGAYVSGTVVGSDTKAPLAAATVALEGGDPLGLVATTTAAGTFRIGPLSPGAAVLHVRHGDHEPRAMPVTAPADAVTVALAPLPRTSLRGRVRSRPDLVPIAGATVVWSPAGGAPVNAPTGADGTFVLPATGDVPARLSVQAQGHLAYAELVTPGAPFADYDVLPASPDVRLQKKLTAVLEGIVVEAAGAPMPGIPVRWHPTERAAAVQTPGRRVLDGASLQLPLVATTAADGTFRIETDAFGPGQLLCKIGGAIDGDRGIPVEARAGVRTNELRLTR